MDQAANVEREISQGPKNDQNDQYQLKHADLLFPFTSAGRFPDAARKPDGLNKGYFFYAFFMPEYLSIVRFRKNADHARKRRFYSVWRRELTNWPVTPGFMVREIVL
jgi:hypothetical protein